MSEWNKRRQWTSARKLKIVLETLGSDRTLAEVCRREGVSPNLVHKWRKQLMDSADAVFARKTNGQGPDRQTQKLRDENQRMKDVIAEITAENLELKKTLSD